MIRWADIDLSCPIFSRNSISSRNANWHLDDIFCGGKICDGVGTTPTDKGVTAFCARQGVVASTAIKDITAGIAKQRVVTGIAALGCHSQLYPPGCRCLLCRIGARVPVLVSVRGLVLVLVPGWVPVLVPVPGRVPGREWVSLLVWQWVPVRVLEWVPVPAEAV